MCAASALWLASNVAMLATGVVEDSTEHEHTNFVSWLFPSAAAILVVMDEGSGLISNPARLKSPLSFSFYCSALMKESSPLP